MTGEATASPRQVLDATALLAYLGDEQGADVVTLAIANGAAISTVNLAEVLAIVSPDFEHTADTEDELVKRGLIGAALTVEPFTSEDAREAARRRAMMAPHGIVDSLGALACSALGDRYQAPPIGTQRSIGTLPDYRVRPTLERPAGASAIDREARLRAAPYRGAAESCCGLYARRCACGSLVEALLAQRAAR